MPLLFGYKASAEQFGPQRLLDLQPPPGQRLPCLVVGPEAGGEPDGAVRRRARRLRAVGQPGRG